MAFAFDTLGHAKKLREAGVEREIAEAHAEAARDFIMAELVTRIDLAAARDHLEQAIEHQTLRLTIRLGASWPPVSRNRFRCYNPPVLHP
jgi:hypothetical protein